MTPWVLGLRLIPVLELVALPWPGLRRVAFWALLGGVVLRTAELGAAYDAPALVPLSGVLVWIALACVAANLAGALSAPREQTPVQTGENEQNGP